MADPEHSDSLKSLEDKIKAAKAAQSEGNRGDDHYSAAQVGWQMVTELVAGIGIGFGIGYGLDQLFGTMPWLMLTFTLLGFVAGIKTMMRSAANLQRDNSAAQAAKHDKRT